MTDDEIITYIETVMCAIDFKLEKNDPDYILTAFATTSYSHSLSAACVDHRHMFENRRALRTFRKLVS